MKKILIIAAIFLVSALSVYAQDSTGSDLLKVWGIDEFIENGKKYQDEDMLEIVVDFQADGTYNYWEENDNLDGVWELSDDGSTIYFDKDTEDEMVWEIVSLSADRLEVKCNYGGRKYRYVFKPKVSKGENTETQENQ